MRFIPACAGNTQAPSLRRPQISVHPRVCGEHSFSSSRNIWTAGSSPRVRGTRRRHCRRRVDWRFIPACAGNTHEFEIRHRRPTVHPRVCGEHVGHDQLQAADFRFIPACAGNTPKATAARARTTVHPRVCGEHAIVAHNNRHAPRFIPACAGNTTAVTKIFFTAAVHPRVCGEHLARASCGIFIGGSSPRVRGTPHLGTPSTSATRFIPACAGNTTNYPTMRAAAAVHPRVCGEHDEEFEKISNEDGSSPRVRGTQVFVPLNKPGRRFIPACAGNTRITPRRLCRSTVHPRVCGEHRAWPRDVRVNRGSSPRVRGTRA